MARLFARGLRHLPSASNSAQHFTRLVLLLVLLPACPAAHGLEAARPSTTTVQLTPGDSLILVDAKTETVDFKGHHALRLLPRPGLGNDDSMLAVVPGIDFHDGTIEIEVSGSPHPGADSTARGFIGVAFRLQENNTKGEYFYLRPTNARCDDQLRRNHSVQYVSAPDYPWERLRKESSGVYETYADMVPGEWTKMKIVVSGNKAQLYVNGAEQPTLIVNDLKLGDSHGQIGLWSHETTDGYFVNLKVTRN